VNLLGTAEGAVYAMRMAQRYPETVSAMILESPGSLTRYYPWKWQQLLTPVLGDWLIRRISDGEMEQALRWLYFDETTIRECEVHQFIQPFRNPQTGRNLLGLLRSFDNREVYRRMIEIRCPVYFIWGENDPCHPVAMSSIFTGSVDGCQFRMLRNCGHLVHEERPVEFCETVSGFLPSGLPGSGEYSRGPAESDWKGYAYEAMDCRMAGRRKLPGVGRSASNLARRGADPAGGMDPEPPEPLGPGQGDVKAKPEAPAG
jgi:alpha-beta hydrolase superfamily lysophospholipase